MNKIAIVVCSLFLVGCQYFTKKKNTETNSASSQIATDSLSIKDAVSSVKRQYIIDRNGAYFKEKPDTNAKTQNYIPYGYFLEIEGEKDDFYKVMNPYTGYYGYIEKNKVGTADQISLITSDLRVMSHFKMASHKEFMFFDEKETKQLEGFVDIELIDKSLYDKAKKESVDFLVRDTLSIVKKQGVLTLPATNSVVTFKDIDSDSDDRQIYKYIGRIDFLNKFVVSGYYWEMSDYRLVDKKTGKQVSFADFPHISPDRKSIIAIYSNPYDVQSELSLYSIDEKMNIKEVFTVGFRNWMGYNWVETNAFWSKDEYFYIPVAHPAKFWDSDGNINKERQYIRIKVRN